MTTRRDDDPNEPSDPVLDSMRSVWLSMRDEDPPASGLTQLLAAARAKAEAMQPRPPWWHRALTVLRRPPVLALATTVVLVGGAALVATRQDQLERAQRAGDSQAELTLRKSEPPVATPIVPSGSADEGRFAEPSTPAPPQVPGTDDTEERKDSQADRQLETASAEPPRPRPRTSSDVRRTAPPPDPLADAKRPPDPPKPEVPAPPPSRPGDSKGEDSLVIAQDSEPGQGAGDGQAPATAPAIRPPEPGDARLKSAAPDTGSVRSSAGATLDVAGRSPPARSVTVDQLARQSATAATRGDCPAVRAITARMQKLDKAFYRDHIAGNALVKNCLK